MNIDPYIIGNTDDAAALAAYQNDAPNWQPVRSKNVLAWLGEAARLYKLEQFVGAGTTDPQTIGLQSAVKTVLLAVANPDTELLLDPASPHRQLLGAMVSVGVLTADDADALIARGRPVDYVDMTLADVAARRSAIELTFAKDAKLVAVEQIASYWRSAINAAESIAGLPEVPSR